MSWGSDESSTQEFAVPAGDLPVTEPDWGITDLAVTPQVIAEHRSKRMPRFEELSATSSTMFETLDARLEQLVGTNNLLPAYWLEEGAARARAVCKIDAAGQDYKGRSGSWSGTGFLVAPGILCTNHHVINSKDVAERSHALFEYSATPDGGKRKEAAFRLRPDLLFWTSPIVKSGGKGGLDATFVAVDGAPGNIYGHFRPLRQSLVVTDDDKLNIVQHPDGRLKEVALRDNTVTWQNAVVLHYTSDTESGSSGAPVSNDSWELIALHHAAKGNANEGVKFSAICAALELDSQRGDSHASQILKQIKGADELLGFFGTLGRSSPLGQSEMERVVSAYSGESQDLDIGFWNIEWFNKRWRDKLDDVARVVIEMNLDVWVFVESSKEATQVLADHLGANYSGEWGVLASQPASSEVQITTVMWNKSTVSIEAREWPQNVRRWFDADSNSFDELGLEAIHGKVFSRFPALFEVSSRLQGQDAKFNLVPVHLKAMPEGRLRRQLASRLLAEAVSELVGDASFDGDWVIGGDFNATLESGDLDALVSHGMHPISAKDATEGQITYIKSPHKSLIDHIYISQNLHPNNDDFMIVALDKGIERFLEISDHRPILLRLTTQALENAPATLVGPLSPEEVKRITNGLAGRISSSHQDDLISRLKNRSIYYDEQADTAARELYWEGVRIQTATFLRDMIEHIGKSHTQKLSYDPSTHVYPWVDLRPNGMVQSIYSGFEAEPEYFISADAESDRKREQTRVALIAEGTLEATIVESILEEKFQYNCEHVVPQSWFSKKEPMRGDLHHLFACESRCNSFRSNYPLVEHEFERSMQDCGRVEDDLFEPKGGKGAVARATLYFILRYPGAIGSRYNGKRLETLLRWHEESPPDIWERHRNSAIYTLQGNRNPFIDFPEWVGKIDLSTVR